MIACFAPGRTMPHGAAADLLRAIDAAAYRSPALAFDAREVRTLLERFPDAVTVLTVDGAPLAYASAFPITAAAAARLVRRPVRRDFALPCTSHDAARALLLMSEVPAEADLGALDAVAWYFDSVAAAEPRAAGLARGAVLRATAVQFARWRRRLTIGQLLTMSVTPRGEQLVRRASLRRFGFEAFEPMWTVLERQCTCWASRPVRPPTSLAA